MGSTVITVRWRYEGLHHWPDAPDHREYLAVSHRHLFHAEAKLLVEHDDREIEFHDLLDFCRATLGAGDYDRTSCEAMARSMKTALHVQYPHRWCSVSVFEDGECGATVEGCDDVSDR